MGLCSNPEPCGATVVLLVFASLIWLLGSTLSLIWAISAKRGLNAGEQGQYRTLLVLKFVLILLSFDFLNAFVGNVLLSLRITGVITGIGDAIFIGSEIALLTAPAVTLSFIGIYRLQASRDVAGLTFDAGLGIGTILSLSLATCICSGFLRSEHEDFAFVIPAVMSLISIAGNGVCSYLTHQNIIKRFPTERDLSFRRLAISVGFQAVLSIPFIVTSFGWLYGGAPLDVDFTMTSLRLSSITNGFIYGWTNRRALPYFRKLLRLKEFEALPRASAIEVPKSPVPSVSGQINAAFKDEVL
ncbi:Oidioi.mRNA.OKI2018_I69.PAR.g10167.t1.cds [Oikopleura dioica]|uniref:Oidioi.mRNA.OKI2018_I69.PAR.g10167.t1.cds n=1 Tax=Oikopleura dioica TaxID=34765 RepID=A0ABN7RS94_OIKDI|nr:Oidioi.mRNA.OKI2018_I69.PAR.g10167.t1.cds [Oikopleura dioica]